MVRVVRSDEFELVVQAYVVMAEKLFRVIFNDEWLESYLEFAQSCLAEHAMAEKKKRSPRIDRDRRVLRLDDEIIYITPYDPLLISKSFFLYAWDLFKKTCYESKIVINERVALDFLTSYVPGREIVWGKLVNLHRELEAFHQLARSQIADYMDEQLKVETETRESNLRKIGIYVETRLRKTVQAQRPDIIEANFGIEISGLIGVIVQNELPCTVEDLQKVIRAKVRMIPEAQLQSLRKYKDQLSVTVRNQPSSTSETIAIDPEMITRHIVLPTLEPLNCVASLDYEKHVIYVLGNEYKLEIRDFKSALEKLVEITPPLFHQKRLNEFLDLIEEYAEQVGALESFAKYIEKTRIWFEAKALEIRQMPGKYGIENDIRYPALHQALIGRRMRHTDKGHHR